MVAVVRPATTARPAAKRLGVISRSRSTTAIAHAMMTCSPMRNAGWFAHCSSGLMNAYHGKWGAVSQGSMTRVQ